MCRYINISFQSIKFPFINDETQQFSYNDIEIMKFNTKYFMNFNTKLYLYI